MKTLLIVALLCIAGVAPCQQTDEPVGNFFQVQELETLEALDSAAPATTAASPAAAQPAEATVTAADATQQEPRATGPALAPGFINFGYLQNSTVLPYVQYEAFTHIATTFVPFGADGHIVSSTGLTGRSANLKAGGAAQRAGTKVIMCVNNNGFSTANLDGAMSTAANRTNLVNDVVSLLTNDTYVHGVNFDFEPSWGTVTRDNITLFLQQLRSALPPQYEISVYVHPTYSTTYWGNIGTVANYVDYVLYSTYDWGTSYAHANSDFNNCLPQIDKYLQAGVPPEKMVLTWASYGRRWTSVTAYNGTNDTADQSRGFYDGLYETTLRQANGGPFTDNYVTGDEVGWYTYNVAGTNYTTVHDTPASLEYKISAALSYPGAVNTGARLRGVGWWSIMWVSNYLNGFQSYDPISAATVTRPPYYRHIDLLDQEILKPPAQQRFTLESFENTNDHWRDPNESPDTAGDTDKDSTFARLAAPAGAGKPAGTVNAGRLVFDFENASGNRVFLRHELVNNVGETAITDTNAELARINKNSTIRGSYYVSGNYSSRQLRLALVDGQREVEVSDPITLPSSSGWYTFQWDINDAAQINAYNTAEPTLVDGDGVVDTASPDARDISFLGFIVEGGGAGAGTIYFDDVTYEAHAPADKSYVINEFSYANNSSEFVEIYGPAGPFPADMKLLTYNSANGAVLKTTSLGGLSIPASGLFVVGDPAVANTSAPNGTSTGWSTGDDLPATAPSAVQLYGSTSGYVYDSIVYKAFGGLGDLVRTSTRRVTQEGFGWSGETGTGTTANGRAVAFGRIPDGTDTNVNENDISLMPPTPGTPNGALGITGTTFNFNSVPADSFQTYQAAKLTNPTTAGIPASPDGGNAYRCIDTNGGGVVAYFGDANLGAEGGIDATGYLYIPATSHPVQAVALGLCVSQGSTFFSGSPGGAGYENGYWLIYENGAVNLADGRSNHSGQFELVMASHDNMDSTIASPLGSRKSLAQLSAAANTWVPFRLKMDPAAAPADQFVVQINSIDVYHGAIPAGGRTTGAFALGFRENDGGTIAATEGTWIDGLRINPASAPAGVQDFMLY